ncbi:MAG: glucosaminidase domain-containing protein [Clostridia bacterium]|nr:glucosaminidase domain-containing protein [Clostridia bacterium]
MSTAILFAGANKAKAAETLSTGIEEPCGLSMEELEAVLKGELKNYAQEFLWAEEDYQINALFLASIAAAESGWGEHQFRRNNIFGFGKCEFESIPKCIDYVAWFLRKHYLNESGQYYRGGTIEAIGKVWCPDGTGDWERLVKGIYGGMLSVAG